MKTAIVYATKYGCTKKCAEILKTYVHGEVSILSVKADKINLSQYDAVFIGGSVYMGKIQKEITHFCKRNLKQLMHKKIGLFACCYTPKDTEGFFETLYPIELINHAFYVTSAGGRMDYEKMNFLYRNLFQSLKKIDGFHEGFTEPEINEGEIKKLAEAGNK
ncbi:MAG: flavodoxin domain-containing protein [Oscillospiraceae bacterium]|nr:flavodoxin domain-containing protein [Oscillospiraceae bacterium]